MSTSNAADIGIARLQVRAWRLLLFLREIAARRSGRVGLLLLGFHLGLAALAPLLVPYGVAMQSDQAFATPSFVHWFGTDQLGRDVFSRTMMGGRVALLVTAPAAALAMLWGGGIGMLLGLLGGRLDEWLMRAVDAFLAIPWLLFLLLIVAIFEAGTGPIVPTLAFFYGLPILRVARAATRQVAAREFVLAARLRGEPAFRLARHEILPNVIDTILVDGTMQWSWMLIAFSSLSFLGLGVSPPTPDWGLMIADARGYLTVAPWAALPPCIALVSLVAGLNFFADAIGKALGIDLLRRPA
jgi:peptide/nickel transport system permease protein